MACPCHEEVQKYWAEIVEYHHKLNEWYESMKTLYPADSMPKKLELRKQQKEVPLA